MGACVALITAMRSEMVPIRTRLALVNSREAVAPYSSDSSSTSTGHVRSPTPVRSPAIYQGRFNDTNILGKICGVGAVRARAAMLDLFQNYEIDHVLIVGIAGAISNTLNVGDVVVPDAVVDRDTENKLRPTPIPGLTSTGALITFGGPPSDLGDISTLRERGVVAVDMETYAVAEVCTEYGCAWSSIRSISDLVYKSTVDSEILALAGPYGRPRTVAVLKYLLRRPHRTANLARLGRDASIAAKRAANAAVLALETL